MTVQNDCLQNLQALGWFSQNQRRRADDGRLPTRCLEVSVRSRNSDGRFRNHNQPAALTERTLRARWLQGEVLRMKRLGFSYEVIAQQIT